MKTPGEKRFSGPSESKPKVVDEPGTTEPRSDEESDVPEPTPAGGLAPLGIGVSWVYKLRKFVLDQELQKFRLDLPGTVEDKKKRLIMFMKGPSSHQPLRGLTPFVYPSPPPVPPLVAPATAAYHQYRLPPSPITCPCPHRSLPFPTTYPFHHCFLLYPTVCTASRRSSSNTVRPAFRTQVEYSLQWKRRPCRFHRTDR